MSTQRTHMHRITNVAAQRLTFDERLPELPLAFDPRAVARRFEQCWPESEDSREAPVTIKECLLQNTTYRPGERCIVTYKLLVEPPDAAPRHTIGVVEVDPAGLKHRLFCDDPQLPWLRAVLRRDQMRERFARALQDVVRVTDVSRITPIRYKPGQHCILRYAVHTTDRQQHVWGKLFVQGGEHIQATLDALHEHSRNDARVPRVPQPLAYVPDLHLLLQAPIADGADLHARVFDINEAASTREHWMYALGKRLGALHQLARVPGPEQTLLHDLFALHEYRATIAVVDQAVAAQFDQAARSIEALAGDRPEPAFVASHGACRSDQWMIAGDDLVMLDLDTFCWANPARDLGNMIAYLRWKALRQPQHAPFIERAIALMLDGYGAVRETPDRCWLALYEATSLLKIAGRRFRSLAIREWPLIPELLDTALATAQCATGNHRFAARTGGAASVRLHENRAGSGGFPALEHALDLARIRPDLEPLLRPLARAGQTPVVTAATLLACKPGQRAVVQYALKGADRRVVIGKVYASPDRAAYVDHAMRRLWHDLFCDGERGSIPQPLGHIARLPLLVYSRADGQSLGELSIGPQIHTALAQTGAWLGALHQHTLPLERQFDHQTELANIETWAGIVADKYQDATDARWIAQELQTRGARLQFAANVPIHKDLHYEHVLVNGRVTVIDFDEIRLGDPTFDLAHFCANLHLLAYRRKVSASQLATLQDHFLDAYARATGYRPDERWLYFYGYSCIKIAKQLCALRGPHPRPVDQEQHRQVQTILAYGRSMLEARRLQLYPV